jgi:bla regulator protein blaR1
MHRVAASVFFLPLLVYAQAPKAVFEAASIKPSDPSTPGYSWNTYPGRLAAQNLSLKNLIMLAWDVKSYQIAGGPKWLDGDRFDITAKMDESEANATRGKGADARIRMALQALLADRFQLRIHADSRPLSAYSLVVAKSGFRLKPVEKVHGSSNSWGRGQLTAKESSIAEFASALSNQMDRPVVDHTGIDVVYEFTLKWSPGDDPDSTASDAEASLFTVIQETLGLKLEGKKVPVPMIAVDRRKSPTRTDPRRNLSESQG